MTRTTAFLLPMILGGCDVLTSANDGSAARRATDSANTGFPFRLADGVSAAGYGLNTNDDGVQNYGELAVDCGGAGNSFCADTVPLDVEIEDRNMLQFNGFEVEYTAGSINGRAFQMLRPLEHDQLPGARWGIVLEDATRLGNDHSPAEFRGEFDQLTFGQQTGAMAISMQGVTGIHPYVFSAQEAVLASRYLREHFGVERVLVGGQSYGGAASVVDAASHPEFFDGVVASAVPYSPRRWMAWTEFSALRNMGADRAVIDPVYYPPLDSMDMAVRQAGLTIDNLDLTQPDNAVQPATFIMGEVDGVWLPAEHPSRAINRMQDEGIGHVDLFVGAEEGHGGPAINQANFMAFEMMFGELDQGSLAATAPGDRAPAKKMRSTSYDHVLRAVPSENPSRRVRELWSKVSQIEGGHMAHAVLAADNALFSGSVQGFVTRRAQDTTGTTQWSVPVGRSVQALAHTGGQLVVGSKRGLAVLDAATGQVLRETPDIGSVHDLVIADIIPDEPGLEIAARADMNELHVESLATGRLLSSSTIGTGGAMSYAAWLGSDALLVPLRAGHVAAFRFEKDGSTWTPVADWLSEYLASDLQVVQPVTIAGVPALLAGGQTYGEGRNPSLFVLTPNQPAIAIDVSNQLATVRTIAHSAGSNVLVAGIQAGRNGERAIEVDLGTGAVTAWKEDVSNLAVLSGGSRVAVWSRGEHTQPSVKLTDGQGNDQHIELGSATSPAIHLQADEDDDVFELSVMSRDWDIKRFDLWTGAYLGGFNWPTPTGADRAPRTLARRDSGSQSESYEPFLSDGLLFGDLRVATRCGRWVIANTLSDEQGSLFTPSHSNERTAQCALWDWGSGPLAAPPAYPLVSTALGEPLPLQEAGDIAVAEVAGSPTVFLASPGGQVASYSMASILGAGAAVAPDAIADFAGTETTLAVDSDLLVTASWLPADDGSTLQVADPKSLDVTLRIDAGPVLAVALADVDRDGATDILTGTQDGWLRAYDTDGDLIFEWSAGDLNLGENGALQVYEGEARTLVAVAVTGGWRVLELR